MKISRRIFVATAPAIVACVAPLSAQAAPPTSKSKGFAIGGFDPVAYFTDKKPVHGKAELSHTWRDAPWLFATADNRAKFMARPETFVPQYGGHCAMSMIDGKLSPGDPDAWAVTNGRLYLNGSAGVRQRWLSNSTEFIILADRQWSSLYAHK